MSIRTRLTLIFGSVLIFVILVISSYSILKIREYLEKKAEDDARALSKAIALDWNPQDDIASRSEYLKTLSEWSHSNIYVLSEAGSVLWNASEYEYPDSSLHRFFELGAGSDFVGSSASIRLDNANASVWVLFSREAISLSLMPIRYIIYYGMLISLALIIIVSIWTARSLSKPISSLTETATEISEGNLEKELHLNRKDEFGRLSVALNRMATTLKDDAEQQKRINERQKQLYADIAHEVRNPIQSIMTSSAVLNMQGADSERKKQAVRVVESQVERLNRLFQDLITLNQLDDSNTATLQVESFNIGEVCRKVIQHHSQAMDPNISVVDKTEDYQVEGDKFRIEQVLENLFINAMLYTERGSIEVSVSEHDGRALIAISDTGLGMSTEEAERVFDRFYRVDRARTRHKGGSGLGLSVVKQILDLHKTQVQLSSTKGKGTRVVFSLPISK